MKSDQSQILLSPEDEDLKQNHIFVNTDGYPVCVVPNGNKRYVRKLHKIVGERIGFFTNMENKMSIDHINRNKLDNRRENLRLINRSANMLNSKSSFKATGVRKSKSKKNPFESKICINGKVIYLGVRSTFEEAHQLYLEAKNKRLTELGLTDLLAKQ